MPEKYIDPKFNIHSSYRKVNIINPYRFSTEPESGTDAEVEYQKVLDLATSLGITLPSASQQVEDLQLLESYIGTGVWDKDDVFFKFKGTASSEFKLLDWKRLIKADNYGSLVWSVDGVKGNGSNGYINPKAPLNTLSHFSQNNASFSYVTFNVGTSGAKAIMGLNVGSGIATQLIVPNNGTAYASLNSDGQTTTASNFSYLGLTSINRMDAVTTRIIAASEISIVKSSLPSNAYTPYILARNRVDTSGVDLFSDAGLSYVRFGASIADEHSSLKLVLE